LLPTEAQNIDRLPGRLAVSFTQALQVPIPTRSAHLTTQANMRIIISKYISQVVPTIA